MMGNYHLFSQGFSASARDKSFFFFYSRAEMRRRRGFLFFCPECKKLLFLNLSSASLRLSARIIFSFLFVRVKESQTAKRKGGGLNFTAWRLRKMSRFRVQGSRLLFLTRAERRRRGGFYFLCAETQAKIIATKRRKINLVFTQ